jgi:hypothetical protein
MTRNQAPVYGSSAMNRALLIARVSLCWKAGRVPVTRRGRILPLVGVYSRSSSMSL